MVVDDHVGMVVASPAERGQQQVDGDALRLAGVGALREDAHAAVGMGRDDLLEGRVGPLLGRLSARSARPPRGMARPGPRLMADADVGVEEENVRAVCWRTATAMFTATVVFPTPPFGAKTPTTCPRRRAATR